MKRMVMSIGVAVFLFFCGVPMSFSDPLDSVPAWYFQLSGKTQGAIKIQFKDAMLTGTGATKAGGVMVITGTYSFVKTDTFSGVYTAQSDFNFEEGTFQGKLSKKGDQVTVNMLSDVGNKYKAKGTMSPPNILINGEFNIILRGRDRGSFNLQSGDSGIPDIFYLSGTGETVYNGSTELEIHGFCDGKGNMYGSWSADGELSFVLGTFSGKFKNGKLSAKAVSIDGDAFTIRN